MRSKQHTTAEEWASNDLVESFLNMGIGRDSELPEQIKIGNAAQSD
ncbi:MAG: hypothetical protein ABIS50_07375 [Luteolibacter sp.]